MHRARGESFVNALQGAAQAQRTSLAKLKKSPNDFARVLKVHTHLEPT
jgi:hypothetical protein